MGFTELEKSVLAKARKEADKKIRQAESEADAIISKVKADAKDAQKESAKQLANIIDMMEKREVASGRLEAKKIILLAKKEHIEEVFSGIDLTKLSKPERKKMLERLLKKAKAEIDVSRIFVNKSDLGLIKGAESSDILGGLVAESKDGRIRVDYSVDSMIEDIRQKHISEVTEILFKNAK